MGDFGILISQYNSVLPTLTDGQFNELQVDVNGRLLVQADVSVVIDFLGLNGAADSSNILIVGTEDGTQTGTAHAFRLDANGALAIQDNGGSITVDAVDLDIRDLDAAQDNIAISDGTDTLAINADGSINSVVSATDLDIRDLAHASDSVSIGDGTDLLAIEADGSINVNANISAPGSEAYNAVDDLAAAGDGLAAINGTFANITSVSVGAGETAYLYGWSFSADKNASGKIVVNDGTNVSVYKFAQVVSSNPNFSEHFSSQGRIEIAGGATTTIELHVKAKSGTGQAAGSLHVRKV